MGQDGALTILVRSSAPGPAPVPPRVRPLLPGRSAITTASPQALYPRHAAATGPVVTSASMTLDCPPQRLVRG